MHHMSSLRVTEQNGKAVVIATLFDREFRFLNRCPHKGCDLSKGRLDGGTLICTCGWQYDLLTGRAMNQPLARLEAV
jgi:nitrite reductase/ring-hydroxylating ferredoxin subunit